MDLVSSRHYHLASHFILTYHLFHLLHYVTFESQTIIFTNFSYLTSCFVTPRHLLHCVIFKSQIFFGHYSLHHSSYFMHSLFHLFLLGSQVSFVTFKYQMLSPIPSHLFISSIVISFHFPLLSSNLPFYIFISLLSNHTSLQFSTFHF